MNEKIYTRAEEQIKNLRVLARAERVRDNPDSSHQEFQRLDPELRSVLGDMDPFWILWGYRHVVARKRAARNLIRKIGFERALNAAKKSAAFCASQRGEPNTPEDLANRIGYLRSMQSPYAPDLEIFDLLLGECMEDLFD